MMCQVYSKTLGHIWGEPHLGKATSCPNDDLLFQRETVKNREDLWALSLENICSKNNSLPPSFFTQFISTVVLMPSATQTLIGSFLTQPCRLEKRPQVWPLDANGWNSIAQRIKICKSLLSEWLLPTESPQQCSDTLSSFSLVPRSWQWGHSLFCFSPAETSTLWVGVHGAQSCSETAEASVWPLHTDIVLCVSIYSSKYGYSR